MVKWALEELLPHRPPMVLIDEIVSFEPETRTLVAKVAITPEQIFYFTDSDDVAGVPNWVAIEYMAQTSAALAGCYDRHVAPDKPARPGLLLGTRKLDLKVPHFEAGKTYRVTATNAFWDSDAAAFECKMTDEKGEVVATATLNAYRPPDLADFLKEQAET